MIRLVEGRENVIYEIRIKKFKLNYQFEFTLKIEEKVPKNQLNEALEFSLNELITDLRKVQLIL